MVYENKDCIKKKRVLDQLYSYIIEYIIGKSELCLGIVAHCPSFFQTKLVSFGRWVVLSSLVWKKKPKSHIEICQ
jgi:hypothetical protein